MVKCVVKMFLSICSSQITVSRVIAKGPKIGLRRDELAEGLRSFPVGNHIAYYVEKGKGIEIARILHPSMDREQAMKR